jgi:hypothetical protein
MEPVGFLLWFVNFGGGPSHDRSSIRTTQLNLLHYLLLVDIVSNMHTGSVDAMTTSAQTFCSSR